MWRQRVWRQQVWRQRVWRQRVWMQRVWRLSRGTQSLPILCNQNTLKRIVLLRQRVPLPFHHHEHLVRGTKLPVWMYQRKLAASMSCCMMQYAFFLRMYLPPALLSSDHTSSSSLRLLVSLSSSIVPEAQFVKQSLSRAHFVKDTKMRQARAPPRSPTTMLLSQSRFENCCAPAPCAALSCPTT